MKAWLADLPTTALVIATGCVLALLTALFFFAATMSRSPIDDGNWTGATCDAGALGDFVAFML
jgi:hypothetical protein